MSLKRHVCRSGRNVQPSTQHLWIGDDILNAAIQRFNQAVLSKRHVSFAPGPLEARKRGTRRRLAHASQGVAGTVGDIDPSLLNGINESARVGKWKWQGPDLSHQSLPVPPPLLSWNPSRPTISPNPTKQDTEKEKETSSLLWKPFEQAKSPDSIEQDTRQATSSLLWKPFQQADLPKLIEHDTKKETSSLLWKPLQPAISLKLKGQNTEKETSLSWKTFQPAISQPTEQGTEKKTSLLSWKPFQPATSPRSTEQDTEKEHNPQTQIHNVPPLKIKFQSGSLKFVIEKLGRCQTLEELRTLASEEGISVRRHSQEILRLLWIATKSFEICFEFLDDDQCDDPSVCNLGFLLEQALQELRGNHDEDHDKFALTMHTYIIPWARKHLSLDTRSLSDITALGQFILRLSVHKAAKILMYDLAVAVLEGLRSSPTRDLESLAPETRRYLREALMEGNVFPDVTPEVQELVFSYVDTMDDVAVTSELLAKQIRSDSAFQDPTKATDWEDTIISKTHNALSDRPSKHARSIIKTTSKILLQWHADNADDRVCQKIMDAWWSYVRRRSALSMENWHEVLEMKSVTPSVRSAILASYAKYMQKDEFARFVFSTWFFNRLSEAEFEGVYHDLKQNLQNLQDQGPVSSLICMLETVQEKIGLEDDFVRHFLGFLSRLRKAYCLREIMYKSTVIDMHVPLDAVLDALQHYPPISTSKSHDIFKHDSRIALESVPALAARLIRNPHIRPDTIWHYRTMRSIQQPTEDASKEDYVRTQYHLLDVMALSFSESHHLSLRQIQRNMGKILNCVRREGLGGVSRGLLLGLLRSTIIRPMEEKGKVSTDAIKYTIGRIQDVEGPEVADRIDRLLYVWSTQMEKQRAIARNSDLDAKADPPSFSFHRKWSVTESQFNKLMIPHERPPPDYTTDRPLRRKRSDSGLEARDSEPDHPKMAIGAGYRQVLLEDGSDLGLATRLSSSTLLAKTLNTESQQNIVSHEQSEPDYPAMALRANVRRVQVEDGSDLGPAFRSLSPTLHAKTSNADSQLHKCIVSRQQPEPDLPEIAKRASIRRGVSRNRNELVLDPQLSSPTFLENPSVAESQFHEQAVPDQQLEPDYPELALPANICQLLMENRKVNDMLEDFKERNIDLERLELDDDFLLPSYINGNMKTVDIGREDDLPDFDLQGLQDPQEKVETPELSMQTYVPFGSIKLHTDTAEPTRSPEVVGPFMLPHPSANMVEALGIQAAAFVPSAWLS